MSTKDSIEQLNSLTPIQREVALKILKDTLEKNKSTTLNEMLETDYDEIPVDIDTFLTDPRYLGKFTNNGKNLTYRKWPEALREWFPNPLAPSPYVEIALTGVKSFADYDSAVAQLSRTSGLTGKDLEAMKASIANMSHELGLSEADVAGIAAVVPDVVLLFLTLIVTVLPVVTFSPALIDCPNTLPSLTLVADD